MHTLNLLVHEGKEHQLFEILQMEMQSNTSHGEETCLPQEPPQPKNQGLRRVLSHDDLTIPEESITNTMKSDEVERINCECCGMAEDCTPTYISRVRENFYGKWLCGLCSEAVQEKKRKYGFSDNKQALEAHMAICKQFNSIARVNPNLSLADAMKNFARKRSQSRDPDGAYSSRRPPERSYSCDHWLGVNTKLDGHQ